VWPSGATFNNDQHYSSHWHVYTKSEWERLISETNRYYIISPKSSVWKYLLSQNGYYGLPVTSHDCPIIEIEQTVPVTDAMAHRALRGV
jgi:hypothetical protein